MGLQRTKLLDVQVVTGISTVGIFTVGITDCTGPVGVASTSYIRGVIMHNTGFNSCTTSLHMYPASAQGDSSTSIATTAYRLLRINLAQNETYFFEPNYPITMVDRESIVVEVRPPDGANTGSGINTSVNVQILGDTDL